MKVVARWASGALCAVPWRCTGDRPSRDGPGAQGTSKSFPSVEFWSKQFVKFSVREFFFDFFDLRLSPLQNQLQLSLRSWDRRCSAEINQVRKGNGDWSDWYPWQAGCIVLPQWEPLSNLDEWLTLGGIIITSEEEPEGDLCSDLGKTTRIGHRFGNVGWRWSLVRWLALQHCGGDGWSYWDGYYFRRCRWKHLSAVAICGSFHDRIGTRWDIVETSWNFDCHAGSVATISVGST